LGVKRVVFVWLLACGGANDDMTVAEPVASVQPEPLPTMSVQPEPLPTTPPPPPPRYAGRSDTTATVNFVEARKHPDSARIDQVIRSAPAWRAFPNVDPIADLDWMTQHYDDMVVFHNAPDAKIDAAIAQVARPMVVSAPNVKAWRGMVNNTDIVFLRAQPHYVRIAPAHHVDQAVREIAAGPPTPPTFHTNEALRVRILQPSGQYPIPGDISEARVWVDSRPADSSADVYAEADCPSPAAAQADALAIAAQIKQQNTIMVRIGTAGLLNNVDIMPDGNKVKMHVRANQQQIEAVVSLASTQFGSP
jgi:hypothetical protein